MLQGHYGGIYFTSEASSRFLILEISTATAEILTLPQTVPGQGVEDPENAAPEGSG